MSAKSFRVLAFICGGFVTYGFSKTSWKGAVSASILKEDIKLSNVNVGGLKYGIKKKRKIRKSKGKIKI